MSERSDEQIRECAARAAQEAAAQFHGVVLDWTAALDLAATVLDAARANPERPAATPDSLRWKRHPDDETGTGAYNLVGWVNANGGRARYDRVMSCILIATRDGGEGIVFPGMTVAKGELFPVYVGGDVDFWRREFIRTWSASRA